jgi:carbohydrate diacid regulator
MIAPRPQFVEPALTLLESPRAQHTTRERVDEQRLSRVARAAVAQISELLDVPVTVIDLHGMVIASSDPPLEGRSYLPVGAMVTVPLRLGAQTGQVIVGPLGQPIGTPPRVVQALAELVVSQLVGSQSQSHHDRKNQLVHDLLLGLATDEATILREAELLGLDLNQPRSMILIDAAAFICCGATPGGEGLADEQIQRRVRAVIRAVVRFFHLPNDTICAYIGDGLIAILKASNTRNLARWADRNTSPALASDAWANLYALRRASEELLRQLRADTACAISIGIGRYHPGIVGLARSYQDARAALELGCRFHGPNQVHCLDRLGVAAFVGIADEHTKLDLAAHLLSPLDHEPDLITTLIVFFGADCNASTAATQLSIHRNTLRYRFDKIASLTGLDPRRFDDAVQIRLALLLRTLG